MKTKILSMELPYAQMEQLHTQYLAEGFLPVDICFPYECIVYEEANEETQIKHESFLEEFKKLQQNIGGI